MERFAHAKRIGCALGGAAGIATAFNAPIGGILYMFEEVTVDSWAPELTLRAFVCTVISALINKAILNFASADVHTLVIFEDGASKVDTSWSWIDVPLVVFLAVMVGCCSAIFSRVLLKVFAVRRTLHKHLSRYQPWAKIFEVVLFAIVCAFAWGLSPLTVDCKELPHHDVGADSQHRRLGASSGMVRYTCPHGEYNEAATLLLVGAEGALKQLYARDNAGQFSIFSLAFSFVLYSILACGIPGLPVPMGLFVPSMFLGGLAGRLLGETFALLGIGTLASPGVYALLGSAAFLSGFTHMSISIVVLLIEASMDLHLIPPLMLAIFVAHSTATTINHHGYDESLILKKGVPFLDAELPHEMDSEAFTAGDLCTLLPDEALLAPTANFDSIRRALACREVLDFPVLENGACVGLTTRSRLQAALQARSTSLFKAGRIKEAQAPHLNPFPEGTKTPTRDSCILRIEDQTTHMESHVKAIFQAGRTQSFSSKGDDTVLQVHRLMDRAPHLLLEDMPVARFYNIFTKTGCHSAIVVTAAGSFCGILTRECLISSTRNAHRPSEACRNVTPVKDVSTGGNIDLSNTGLSCGDRKSENMPPGSHFETSLGGSISSAPVFEAPQDAKKLRNCGQNDSSNTVATQQTRPDDTEGFSQEMDTTMRSFPENSLTKENSVDKGPMVISL